MAKMVSLVTKGEYREQKGGNRDVIERYDTLLTKVTYGKYATRLPDEVAYGIYEWFSSQ